MFRESSVIEIITDELEVRLIFENVLECLLIKTIIVELIASMLKI